MEGYVINVLKGNPNMDPWIYGTCEKMLSPFIEGLFIEHLHKTKHLESSPILERHASVDHLSMVAKTHFTEVVHLAINPTIHFGGGTVTSYTIQIYSPFLKGEHCHLPRAEV